MYKLGKKSKRNLVGVYPPLATAVMIAIGKSKVDFSVFEGVRTLKRQKFLFQTGKSRTLRSYHLHGLAVDLVPYTNGRLSWASPADFKEIERAMNEALDELGFDYIKRPFDWDLAHWQCTGKKDEYDIRRIYKGLATR